MTGVLIRRPHEDTGTQRHTGRSHVMPKAKVGVIQLQAKECQGRGMLIAIQSYLRKQEKSQINNLTLHLKQREKEEQTKPKVTRRKEIIKMRAEINEIEMKKTIEKINETKSWFSEKINKNDKRLAGLIKKKREKAQINKIRNEKQVKGTSLVVQWLRIHLSMQGTQV